jgi:hypothetical protein
VGWSGNGLRVLGITLMPPSGNPRLSRCAALAAKIEKLSQTVRPSLGWDKDSKCDQARRDSGRLGTLLTEVGQSTSQQDLRHPMHFCRVHTQ